MKTNFSEPPFQKESAVRKVEMVPFDDFWPGYEEPVFEIWKIREWVCLSKTRVC